MLFSRDRQQVLRNGFRGYAAQIESLAPACDCSGNLLGLRGGQDELHVLGRFLERLQQGVEGAGTEHVHLVDEVDLEWSARRRIRGIVAQFADIIDSVVARPVNLQDVQAAPFGNLLAGIAFATWCCRGTLRTIQRLGEEARRGGLADSTRTNKKISLRHASRGNGILQGARDVILAQHFLKSLRPVFPRKDTIAHPERINPHSDFGSRKALKFYPAFMVD